jgi:hypothetical protein
MDILTSQIRSDFSQVRFMGHLNRIWNALSDQPSELLSFDELKERVRIGVSVYRGIKTIRTEQIIGSLNRNHEFDRDFRPIGKVSPQRWQSVNRAFYEGVSLPAIVLYKVGDVYFVVDGHHRVSVARKQGQVFIDAEVREFKTKCKITPGSKLKDLERLCSNCS